jgi:hypothetical protein
MIALNPWVAPFVYGKVHYLLHRFLLNIPALVITSLVIGSLISWGRRGNFWRKGIAVLLLFLWAKPFLLGTTIWHRDIRSVRFDGGQPPVSGDVANAIRFLNDEADKGSVVLSDAMTSYAVSGFSHARVVAVLGQHGNPNDPYPIERLSAIHTVLSPYTTQIEAVKAIERFGVDYVLVNGSFAGPVHGFMSDWDPKVKPTLEKKLGNLKNVFKRVYQTDRIIVYEVMETSIDRVTWHPEAPFTREPAGSLERCELPAHHAGYEVTGIRIEPDVALPGERFNLTLACRGRDDARSSFPLTLHIRFEEKAYFEGARRYLGDKHVRRYRERRDAAFRRFRIDRKPFKGLYLPDEWPVDRECYDEFSARLPTDLNEGVYEAQLKLVEDTLLPNFAVRDFFFNDDSFVGTPCGEIEIRKYLVRPGAGDGKETGTGDE